MRDRHASLRGHKHAAADLLNDTLTQGDVLYVDANGDLVLLPAGSNGQVLTLASGVPSWAAGGGGGSQTPWASDIDGAGFGLDNIDRLEVQDAGGTDSGTLTHDGTDFNFDFTNTANVDFAGQTGMRVVSNLSLMTGGDLYIYDGTNTDSLQMHHDGTDFNFDFTNTLDVNLTGAADYFFDANSNAATNLIIGPTSLQGNNADGYTYHHAENAGVIYGIRAGMASTTLTYSGSTAKGAGSAGIAVAYSGLNVLVQAASYVRIQDGAYLRIQDAADTDWMLFQHDGTDFNMTGTNTAAINITGITQLVFPQADTPTTPMLAFGDGDSGIYEQADDILRIAIAGVARARFYDNYLDSTVSRSYAIRNAVGAAATPTYAFRTDENTGIWSDTADTLKIALGGVNNVTLDATALSVGNYVFNTDQTVGVGQDNYVLTYDNASGEIGLEAAAGGGGGMADLIDDTTPQLGGSLDLNGFDISFSTSTHNIQSNGAALEFKNLTAAEFRWNNDIWEARSGSRFRVLDTGNTDYLDISHDGTDANITATNTTDLNITGITDLTVSGTVDGRDIATDGTKLDTLVAAKPGAFEATGSTNVTTTVTTVALNTEVYDPDTNYSNTAGEITVTDAGYYHVSCNVPVDVDGVGGQTRARVFLVLQKDAATGTWTDVNHIRGQDYINENADGGGVNCSGIVQLVANEVIRMRIDAAQTTDLSTETGEASLSIFKIRD